MSRIGRKPIEIPQKVEVRVDGGSVKVKGPKGNLAERIPRDIDVKVEAGQVHVAVSGTERHANARQGLMRVLVANMIHGVVQGYSKTLDLVGTGYRVDSKDARTLVLEVGFSHKVEFPLPEGISASVAEKNVRVTLSGADKHLVGQVAANIRRLRPPEPYKGKGIRYMNEVVRQKAGKAGAKAAT